MKARIFLSILALCLLPINFGCGPMKSLVKGASKGAFSKVKKYTGKCGKYVFGVLSNRYSDPTNVVGDINTASKKIGNKYLKNNDEVKSYIYKYVRTGSVATTMSQDVTDIPSAVTDNAMATSYFAMSRDYEKTEKINNAIAYYEKAINVSTNDEMKAIYNYSIAKLLQKHHNNYIDARTYAREAIRLKSNYGLAYITIATLYASNLVGGDSFEKSMTYWLAIDVLNKAKLADPSIATEAQTFIDSYSKLCPKKEEAFMHNITNGKTVLIGGWINETTQARF